MNCDILSALPSKIWEPRNGANWNLIQREFWKVVTYLGRFGPAAQTVKSCTWSHPRKRSPSLVSMNRLTPFLASTPIYLCWCISRISCPLSEWADWIDVFPLHEPFHTHYPCFSHDPEHSLPPLNGSVVCSKDILTETCCFCGAQLEFRLFYTEKEVVFEFPAVPHVLPDTFPWGRIQFGVKVESSATGQSCSSHLCW